VTASFTVADSIIDRSSLRRYPGPIVGRLAVWDGFQIWFGGAPREWSISAQAHVGADGPMRDEATLSSHNAPLEL